MPHKDARERGFGKVFYGMKHMNSNVLCAIDTETTGLDPEESGIIEVAIIPLNHMLDVHEKLPMFHMTMRPDPGETIHEAALRVNKAELGKIILNANSRDTVADLLLSWFDSLELPPKCKLIPLAHNWPFDRAMLMKWLGKETFNHIFNHLGRDTMVIANYLNDFYASRDEPIPYISSKLSTLCHKHHIENIQAHSAMSDAYATAQLYKALVRQGTYGAL